MSGAFIKFSKTFYIFKDKNNTKIADLLKQSEMLHVSLVSYSIKLQTTISQSIVFLVSLVY